MATPRPRSLPNDRHDSHRTRPGARRRQPPPARRLPGEALPLAGRATASRRITLNRPERKNPLTFDSYAELRDLFERLRNASDVKAVVIVGAGDNFCSGGDVHEIIGPLVELKAPELLMFTRMTGDLVKAMRACPQPIVAAIDGVCAGAGAIIAMASDLRVGTARSEDRVPLHPRRPRRLRHGRMRDAAAHHRPGTRQRAAVHRPLARRRRRPSAGASSTGSSTRRRCSTRRSSSRDDLAAGPTFANGITKKMLHQEWAMTIEQAIEAEAQAQAICMLTQDFTRAYEAFVGEAEAGLRGD